MFGAPKASEGGLAVSFCLTHSGWTENTTMLSIVTLEMSSTFMECGVQRHFRRKPNGDYSPSAIASAHPERRLSSITAEDGSPEWKTPAFSPGQASSGEPGTVVRQP